MSDTELLLELRAAKQYLESIEYDPTGKHGGPVKGDPEQTKRSPKIQAYLDSLRQTGGLKTLPAIKMGTNTKALPPGKIENPKFTQTDKPYSPEDDELLGLEENNEDDVNADKQSHSERWQSFIKSIAHITDPLERKTRMMKYGTQPGHKIGSAHLDIFNKQNNPPSSRPPTPTDWDKPESLDENEETEPPSGLNRAGRRDLSNKIANTDDSRQQQAAKSFAMSHLAKTNPQAAYKLSTDQARRAMLDKMKSDSGIKPPVDESALSRDQHGNLVPSDNPLPKQRATDKAPKYKPSKNPLGKTNPLEKEPEKYTPDKDTGMRLFNTLEDPNLEENDESSFGDVPDPEMDNRPEGWLVGPDALKYQAQDAAKYQAFKQAAWNKKNKEAELKRLSGNGNGFDKQAKADLMKRANVKPPEETNEASTDAVAGYQTPKTFKSKEQEKDEEGSGYGNGEGNDAKKKREYAKRAHKRRGDEPFGRDALPTPELEKIKRESFNQRMNQQPIWKLDGRGVPVQDRSVLSGAKTFMVCENTEPVEKIEETFKDKMDRLNAFWKSKI